MKNILKVLLILFLVVPAFSQVTQVDENTGGAGSGDPQSIVGTLGGGNYYYIGVMCIVNTQTIDAFTGGGFTWNLSAPITQGTAKVYRMSAQGTADANPFDCSIDLSISTACAAVITVYSGVDGTTPIVNETTNQGNNASPTVTISSTGYSAGSDIYWNGIGFRGSGNSLTADADWVRANQKQSSASNAAICEETGTDNAPVHSITSNNWVIYAGIIKAAAADGTRNRVIMVGKIFFSRDENGNENQMFISAESL